MAARTHPSERHPARTGIVVGAFASLALSACTQAVDRSGFDIHAGAYRADSPVRCERYAYETGRSRYENMIDYTGEAFTALQARNTAERAFVRCQEGRLN